MEQGTILKFKIIKGTNVPILTNWSNGRGLQHQPKTTVSWVPILHTNSLSSISKHLTALTEHDFDDSQTQWQGSGPTSFEMHTRFHTVNDGKIQGSFPFIWKSNSILYRNRNAANLPSTCFYACQEKDRLNQVETEVGYKKICIC